MATNTTANSRLKDILYTIRNISLVAAGVAVLAGVGFLAYAAVHLNSENIRKSVKLEATGQMVKYLERTPRSGTLSHLSWNDKNGHAILEIYASDGNLEAKAFDEDLDGSLLGQGDRLEVILKGGKKVTCFSDKAINSANIETVFKANADPIEDAKISGASDYCGRQFERADSIYQTVMASK